jgi:hypothetical protein
MPVSGPFSISIEQGPWEANSFWATQEDSQTFWDLMVLYDVHESLPLIPYPEPD